MNENVRYCRDLVRRVRWTEYVGSLLLPENVRPLHWGLIALNYELFRIRYMGQERTTNQSRPAISDAVRMGKLNFWIDTLLNTKSTGDLANPVVDVIKRSSIGIIQNYEILMEALLNAHVNNLTNKTAISLRSYYEDNSLVDIHAAPLKMVLDAMHSGCYKILDDIE